MVLSWGLPQPSTIKITECFGIWGARKYQNMTLKRAFCSYQFNSPLKIQTLMVFLKFNEVGASLNELPLFSLDHWGINSEIEQTVSNGKINTLFTKISLQTIFFKNKSYFSTHLSPGEYTLHVSLTHASRHTHTNTHNHWLWVEQSCSTFAS